MHLRSTLDVRRGRDLIARFAGVPVLVVGDVMLDRFLIGRVTRISPEAPVPVVRYESEQVRLGGAANVAHNIAALGGRPMLVGVVGTDPAARALRDRVSAAGISDAGLVEIAGRPTTQKVRIVTERHQQVARIDYETDDELLDDGARTVIERIGGFRDGARAVLVSDYLKGAVTQSVMDALRWRTGAPLIVDPKIPHLPRYAGATLVTPNHHEAETATHRVIRTDDDARAAGRDLRNRISCESVLITRGERGMWLSASDVEGSIPAAAREVADVTGAGDTVAATLALALAAGATLVEAATCANHAAGIVVGKFGAATVTADELIAALERTQD